MLNKNRKPLISFPENEDYARLIFKKQEEMKTNIPIIIIPEESVELRNEVQSLANEKGIDIAIIGAGNHIGRNSTLAFNIAAMYCFSYNRKTTKRQSFSY